jgi:pimeloyl-ACP methyl ester carboxylesterase
MDPVLVLLPGMDGTGDLFAPLVQALGPAVSTIVVRYPDEPLDYPEHERVAVAALPTDRPYVVLGESFSGPIAVTISARSPAGLLGCVLCASFLRSPSPLLGLLRPFLGLLPPQNIPEALAVPFLMGRFATAELRRARAEALKHVSPESLVARLRAIVSVDVTDEAQKIRVPTLYLRATEDRLVPRGAAAAFSRFVAHGHIVDVEGPHFLLQTNPLAAARAVSEFMRKALG